tara:strand:- start:1810 stop:2022 length:213 start_codon:yes stop_codon:yes gene_type:complete
MTLLEDIDIIWHNTEILNANQEKIIEVLLYIIVAQGLTGIIQMIFLYEYWSYQRRNPPLNLNTKCSVASF